MKLILLLIVLPVIVSFLLTWVIRNISLKRNILDIPNERSSHKSPTPRGGGLAIVLTWYIAISFLFACGSINKDLYFALLSGILLAVISLLDDLFGIKPVIRLSVQLISVVIAFIFLGGIHPIPIFGLNILPDIIRYPLVIIGMVWFINLFNFLDGIDGYASFETITLGLIFFLFTGENINLVLASSVFGFLLWNWPKARIFMGDVGSTQLGFILIVLGINFHNENKLPFIFWLILTAPFWFDATLTLYRRWRNHEKLSQAHRNHIYQRLVQSGISPVRMDIFLVVINVILFFLISIVRKSEHLQILMLVFYTPVSIYCCTLC